MVSVSRRNRLVSVMVGLAVLLSAPGLAWADHVVVTYSAAKQTAPNTSAICATTTVCDYGLENFSTWTGSSVFTSTFKDAGAGTYNQPTGVTFTGTYSAGAGTTTGTGGAWVSHAADQYGGVNGGNYPELFGNTASQVTNKGTGTATYNLALSSTGVPGINYFGIWISALDPYNDLTIYSGTRVIAQFNSPSLLAQLGSCPGSPVNAYCGNPTTQFLGQDSGELFVYVNVFDLNGFITSVSLTNSGSTGFESTNHAVAYLNPVNVVGTQVPEPGTLAILGSSLAGLAMVRRRGVRGLRHLVPGANIC